MNRRRSVNKDPARWRGVKSDPARWRGLREYAELISTSRSIHALTRTLVETSLTTMNATSACLSRLEPARGRRTILDHVGDVADWEHEWADDRFYSPRQYDPLVKEGTRHLYWTGSLDDASSAPDVREMILRLGMRHAACFRVLVAERVWGDLCVTRSKGRTFDEDDCAAGTVLVGLLTAGLSRLEMLSDLSTLAYSDSLTGLANRRAADEWLDQRLSAPGQFSPVSMVLCDVDGLKRVNDEFGHTAGDGLLRLAAAALTKVAGTLDDVLVARLGGDEFVVMTSGADPAKVDAVEIYLAKLQLPHGSGLSVGVSTSGRRPAEGQTVSSAAKALLRMADAAQYRHKRARSGPPEALAAALVEPSGRPPVPAGARGIAGEVLRAFRGAPTQTTEWRLQAVCDAVSRVYDAGSWWVSREQDGVLIDVLGCFLRPDARGDLAELEVTSGQEFDPVQYPATAKALDGGSYYASLIEGELTERAFLAREGYISVLAAGERASDGTGWFVEIFGDPRTSTGLSAAEPTLRALVHVAVSGAPV